MTALELLAFAVIGGIGGALAALAQSAHEHGDRASRDRWLLCFAIWTAAAAVVITHD